MQAYIMQKRDGTLQLKHREYSGKLLREIKCSSLNSFDTDVQNLYKYAKELGYTIIDDTFNNKIVNL